MSFVYKKNNASTTIRMSNGVNTSITSIVVTDASKLYNQGNFFITVWNGTDYSSPSSDPNMEIMLVTNVSSNTLTVIRGQDGTSAKTHSNGDKVEMLLNKGILDEYETAITNLQLNTATSWGDGLIFSNFEVDLDYNTTNLKITSGKLNTIQDIDTGADVVFNTINIAQSGIVDYLNEFGSYGRALQIGDSETNYGILSIFFSDPTKVKQTIIIGGNQHFKPSGAGESLKGLNLTISADGTNAIAKYYGSHITLETLDFDGSNDNLRTETVGYLSEFKLYAGSDTDAYCFKGLITNVNNVTDLYGLYLDIAGGKTNNYAIYTNNGKVYHAGETEIANNLIVSGALSSITLSGSSFTSLNISNWNTAYSKTVNSVSAPLSLVYNPLGELSLLYTDNLKISTNSLDTVQDIKTTSSPTFANITNTGYFVIGSGSDGSYKIEIDSGNLGIYKKISGSWVKVHEFTGD